jgi:hypothetical protein
LISFLDRPEPLRTQIREAFVDSIRVIWYTLIGVSALGLFVTSLFKSYALHKTTDERFGLQDKIVKNKVVKEEKKQEMLEEA